MINSLRGMKDILPDQINNWLFIEDKLRSLCKRYNYKEIRTPILEQTELFQRSIGSDTDVVNKEMYTFNDRGNHSISLRPENTVSIVRAYLQNKLTNNKLFYIGPMFRYDRPQQGRLRQFHQFGVEIFNESDPLVDAELITFATNLLKEFNFTDYTLKINSIGCPKCRSIYRQTLKQYFEDKLNLLCDDCKKRYENNPLRLLDCKVDQNIINNAPKIQDFLCDKCKNHFDKVLEYLSIANIPFTIDNYLVRGLDYYTKTVFEIQYNNLAILGGGRYDNLIEEFDNIPNPAIGFAIGIERLLSVLEQNNLLPSFDEKIDIYCIILNDEAKLSSFKLISDLRSLKLAAVTDYKHNIKSAIKLANKLNARFVFIIGEDELKNNSITIKNLSTREQVLVPNDINSIYKKVTER